MRTLPNVMVRRGEMIDGIESGNFIAQLHRPPAGPFWRPIFRSWLIWGGCAFWVWTAAKIVRFVAGVWL